MQNVSVIERKRAGSHLEVNLRKQKQSTSRRLVQYSCDKLLHRQQLPQVYDLRSADNIDILNMLKCKRQNPSSHLRRESSSSELPPESALALLLSPTCAAGAATVVPWR